MRHRETNNQHFIVITFAESFATLTSRAKELGPNSEKGPTE
jgi:hypothetical protein